MNRIFGRDVVERKVGGKQGGSTMLTDLGIDLITRYRRIELTATTAGREDLVALEANRTTKARRNFARLGKREG